jgi:glycine/D-amino acid oxidase-like deaminating enzyme
MDVEIVGAGFAGRSCARTCAARGLQTVVWERKRDPGHALRTSGILVREAAEEDPARRRHAPHPRRQALRSVPPMDRSRRAWVLLRTNLSAGGASRSNVGEEGSSGRGTSCTLAPDVGHLDLRFCERRFGA